MTYLFKELEAKISTLQLTHSCRPQPYLIDSILSEILQIKARLKETFFQPWDDQTFEKFTRIHNETLIELMNIILTMMDLQLIRDKHDTPDETPEHEKPNLKATYESLDDLLRFMHPTFR